MASNHTQNYGLSLWEPEDAFIRAEFNEDHGRVDAALRRTEDKADRALTDLIYVGYNVYNLALRDYYDGKYTGWKKAMVFDGFLDESMIASLTAGLVRTRNRVSLTRTGQGDISLGYGIQGEVLTYNAPTRTCTLTGNGSLTGFTVKTERYGGGSATGNVTYSLARNGTVVRSGSAALTFAAAAERVITFSPAVPVAAGDQLVMSVQSSGSDDRVYLDGSGKLGGWFRVTPRGNSQGTLTTPALALPSCKELRAWVRYKGGSVFLYVTGKDGEKRMLSPGAPTPAVNHQGQACMEQVMLMSSPPAGDLTFTFTAYLNESSSMEIYDYGIILL